jgi:hypothetical protein
MSLLRGAIDLHVHAGPSLFPRSGDAVELASAAAGAGMRALLLKAHEGSTVEAAAVADRLTPRLSVYGGTVLNRGVGGLNPAAVEIAFRLGGRCVWFPTVDSADHARAYGATGGYDAQCGGLSGTAPVEVVSKSGRLLPGASEVLALARDHGALIATGHLAWREIRPLLDGARDLGYSRVLVQHPLFRTPELTEGQIEAALAAGAVLEITALSALPAWGKVPAELAASILRRAPGRVVITSDGGQRDNPPPPQMLERYLETLRASGAPECELARATHETPAALLAP